jgi:hypothetical protein
MIARAASKEELGRLNLAAASRIRRSFSGL